MEGAKVRCKCRSLFCIILFDLVHSETLQNIERNMKETQHVFHHPLLGEFHGLEHSTTVEFLGVKYGYLEGKFSPPIIYHGDKSDIVDATKLGYGKNL